MLKNLYSIIDYKEKIKIIFLIFALTLSSLLDVLGITLIPILATSLLGDPSLYIDSISSYGKILNFDYFLNLTDKERISLASIIIVTLFVFKNIFLIVIFYYEGKVVEIISLKNAKRLFKYYLLKNYLFHLNSKPVLLSRNIVVENQAIKINISSSLYLAKEIILLFGITFILLLTNWFLTLILIGSLTLLILFYLFFIKNNIEKRGKINQEIRGFQINFLTQGFRSIKEIIFFNKQKYIYDIFNTKNIIFEKNILFVNLINKFPKIFLEIFTILIIIIISLVLTSGNGSSAEMIGSITLITAACIRLIPSYNSIVTSVSRMQFVKPSVDLISNELNSLRNEADDFFENKNVNKLLFKDKLEIKNVNFVYPGSDTNVFKDLNFILKKGDLIGILGPSGSGKTTFVNLISGLIDPTNGLILLDGEPLMNKKNEWINSIGYVGQDIFLIDDSIKKNIAFGEKDKDINIKNLLQALDSSGLNSFKEKLDYEVGENGSKLSGGQKQRIGIARALYRQPNILILDEATNALDKSKESQILDSIFDDKSEVTAIMISHDIQSLRKCEKIFNLTDGKITNY